MQVDTTGRIPIYMWLDDLEEKALEQAKNLSNLPFAFKHVALMPDAHMGYGMPIGGVLATNDVVIPNAVGVDIGCGMCAVRTDLIDVSRDKLTTILGKVRGSVPVGFNHHSAPQSEDLMPNRAPLNEGASINQRHVVDREYQRARTQIGTLGGGNHFLEVQRGDGNIWVMIHSGSRNLGKQVADHYNKLAVELNQRWFSSVPKEHQLAFLPLDTDEAQAYLREMQYCVDFALANRRVMMDRVLDAIRDVFPDLQHDDIINIAHNYAAQEHHFGENVWVHRKGATRAREGELGIIPGSQGTKSYIVRGKGNRDSFQSCSHGAGRKMGRKAAQRTLDLKEQIRMLDDKGIVHSIRTKKDLDEAPGAYKNIRDVMKNQSDLVETVVKLSPLAVVKG